MTLFEFYQYHIAAEAMAAIAACITWHKWKNNNYKWFAFYLLGILAVESYARIMIYNKEEEEVALLNQTVAALEMVFINYFFSYRFKGNQKAIVLIGLTAYITTFILEQTLLDGEGYFFRSLSYTVGNMFILIYLIIFFLQFVNSDKILDYKRYTVFWIVLGMLTFYLGTFPFYGLYNELAKNLDIFVPIGFAAMGLNYVMYIFFTIGLIWGKPD